jgi:hypothetical protein
VCYKSEMPKIIEQWLLFKYVRGEFTPPMWNSVTRSCRAILDLDDKHDGVLANYLADRIAEKNEGFDLIGGAF